MTRDIIPTNGAVAPPKKGRRGTFGRLKALASGGATAPAVYNTSLYNDPSAVYA